jgi:hypothetical protein
MDSHCQNQQYIMYMVSIYSTIYINLGFSKCSLMNALIGKFDTLN